MLSPLRFDGQVVIVTGGAGALGEAYCLEFARRGAFVVVSDVGARMGGDGQNSKAADRVVDKIVAAGGKAIADYHNIATEGEKVVDTAVRHFGTVHVVVNNAGNLRYLLVAEKRDKTFRKMSLDDWEAVQKVHVVGAFMVTKAAWPHFEKQKYGRIIMTSSAAGLYGAYGQANYSTAKLGLHGFTQTLAQEGGKLNIKANTIAPLANSRMLASVLPADLIRDLKPENISAMVMCLAHPSCPDSGALFELGGKWYARVRWQRSQGLSLPADTEATAEAVSAGWSKINAFDDKATNPRSGRDAFLPIVSSIGGADAVMSSPMAAAVQGRSRL